jgi:hypothetical protein
MKMTLTTVLSKCKLYVSEDEVNFNMTANSGLKIQSFIEPVQDMCTKFNEQ